MHAERKSSGKSKTVHVGRIRSQVAIEPMKKEVVYVRTPPPNKIIQQARLAAFGVFVVVCAALTLGSQQALAGPVCSNTPTVGDRVECVVDGVTGDVNIDIENIDITGTETGVTGNILNREGNDGNVTIKVNRGKIDVTGDDARGIDSELRANGKLLIDVQDVDITTNGANAGGVETHHWGTGAIVIDVQGGSFTTESTVGGVGSHALQGLHQGMGDIDIDVHDGTSIITKGNSSHGIHGTQAAGMGNSDGNSSMGNVFIDLLDSSVVTEGYAARGIFGRNSAGGGGDIDIYVRDSSITTNSISTNAAGDTLADGIYANHEGSGDIDIDTERAVIETKGVFSKGVFAFHEGAGSINLDIRGGSVKTAGEYAYGIYGSLSKTDHGGTISIRTSNGNDITTTGDNGHGIVAYNYGTMDTSSIAINVEGDIHTSGTGAQGVRVGAVNASNVVERAAGFDAKGYRKQTVTVNGRVMGNDAGVYLAGGGRVVIGPKGSVGAQSGIAILATGEVPADDTAMTPAIKPKLWVDLNLDGRRVAQAIGHNWIINDGGETTIAVNDIVLHKGATGIVTDAVAYNGAWNIRMREKGVMVDRSTDPWTISAPATNVFADRDFSVQDFMQAFAARTQVARAQCSDATLTTQAPITNEAAVDSTTDLNVNADGVKISATGATESGINQVHHGEGDITVNVSNSCVETSGTGNSGDQASGVLAASTSFTDPATNEGDVKIDVRDSTITTTGPRAKGIVGGHTHTGDVDIDVSNTNITTTGERAYGIYGQYNTDTGGIGDVTIDATDVNITTEGNRAGGIWGLYTGPEGDLSIHVRGGSITTDGNHNEAFGIRGSHNGDSGTLTITAREGFTIDTHGNYGRGIWGERINAGNPDDDIIIKLSDGEITTRGFWGDAIYADHRGPGMIDIDLEDVTIETQNTAVDPTHSFAISRGILAVHRSTGDVDVNVRGGSIRTWGPDSQGIDARNMNADSASEIRVTTLNTPITTWGARSNGIYARHFGSNAERAIAIDVGGDIHAIGTGASGVKVGSLNNVGEVINAGALDEDGTRRQTVTVNGRVMGNEAGVYLAGGGRVFIGPKGSVGAQSGIAILATGDTPGANPGDPVIKPKLHVDMNLDGRRVAQVIGNDWIMNDQGETTIAVNGTVLHKGATDEGAAGGVTGLTAPNGAWNVTMREKGVTVDRTDPASWVISAPTTGVVVDRDFSTQDFTETRRPRPPAPLSSCPDGQVGTPPDCADAETEMPTEMRPPMFTEEYAPRAALYESLPGFLLRLRSQGHTGARLVSPGSPVWLALSTGSGSVDPSRSTTGADYDLDRIEVQAGRTMDLGKNLTGWVALHHAQGDSEVSSPTGGGDIDAKGRGVSIGALWSHAGGYYLDGSASWTDYYDIDFSSDDLGRLKSNVDALGTSLGLETGRRMVMGTNLHLTPRAWLSHSSIDVDSFTDAVGARASFSDEARLVGGIGASAQTLHGWKGGELTWHGSLDLEQTLNSRSTSVNVSGEKLKSETVSTRMLLGLGSLYRKGDLSISGQVSVDGLGTDDEDYSGQVNIGVRL